MSKQETKERAIALNRRAKFEYHIDDTYEAGIVLSGSEVKSLREGQANLSDAFARASGGEMFLLNLHIPPYAKANIDPHEPTRTRKLLLHKGEIERLRAKTQEKGLTVVPLKMYWKDGRAKVLLGVGRGKKLHDKRQVTKERDVKREMDRAMKAAKR